ncbi:MAG: hypothetical protein HN509_09530 [Halobacteriovoraceae bacterium]|jgi:hypothetical protein|nr:hypothetical protein [Halobacteriovoraceae bacterium]
MPKVFLALLLLITGPLALAAPESYMKNEQITTKSEVIGEKSFFTFGFKDNSGNYHEWTWSDDTEKLYSLSKAFGLYNKDPQNFTYNPDELPNAFFKEHFTLGVIPDYNALVSRYYHTVTKLYNNWVLFRQKGQLNNRQSIELILRFFQDFPYGVPPTQFEGRLIGGLFVAPLVFKYGWADCDSKALLMATVLAHDPYFKDKVAMIMVPGHALLGIRIQPGPYDQSYRYQNQNYVVAEPTGLARTPLGQKNSPYSKLLGVEPIYPNIIESETSKRQVSPTATSSSARLTDGDCPDGGLLLDYQSKLEGGHVLSCRIKIGADYVKHGPTQVLDASGTQISKKIFIKGQ